MKVALTLFLSIIFTLNGVGMIHAQNEFWKRPASFKSGALDGLKALKKEVPEILQNKEFKMGIEKIEAGEYESALNIFTSFATNSPKDVRGQYLLGISQLFAKKYNDAIHTLGVSMAMDQDPAEKQSLHYFRGFARYAASDYKRAAVDFHVICLKDEHNPVANFWFGEASGMAGDFEDAVAGIELAVKYGYEDQANLYTRLGEFGFLSRDYENAWKNLEKAELLNPGNAIVFYYEGEIHIAQDDYERAMEDLNKAIERATEDQLPVFLKRAAELTGWLNKFNISESYYTQILKSEPENADIYYKRGITSMKLGKFSNAVQDFAQAIQFGYKDQEAAFFQMGFAANRCREYSAAIMALDQKITMSPKDGEAYHERSIAKLSSEDFKGAEADAKKAIQLGISSDPIFARLTRGMAVLKQNRFREATVIFDEILKENPKFVPAYSFRAEAKAGLNNFNGALADIDKALAIDPDNRKALATKKEIEEKRRR